MAIEGYEYDRQSLARKAMKKKKTYQKPFFSYNTMLENKIILYFFEKLVQIYIQPSNLYNKWK